MMIMIINYFLADIEYDGVAHSIACNKDTDINSNSDFELKPCDEQESSEISRGHDEILYSDRNPIDHCEQSSFKNGNLYKATESMHYN